MIICQSSEYEAGEEVRLTTYAHANLKRGKAFATDRHAL